MTISNDNTSAEGTEEGDFVIVDRLLNKGPGTFTFRIKTSAVLDLGVGVAQFAEETEEERDQQLENSIEGDAASEDEEGGEDEEAAEKVEPKETFFRTLRSFEFHLRDRMTHYKHNDQAEDEEDLDESTHTMHRKPLELKQGDEFSIDVEEDKVRLIVNGEEWDTIIDSPLLKSGNWYPVIGFGDPDGDVVELVASQ